MRTPPREQSDLDRKITRKALGETQKATRAARRLTWIMIGVAGISLIANIFMFIVAMQNDPEKEINETLQGIRADYRVEQKKMRKIIFPICTEPNDFNPVSHKEKVSDSGNLLLERNGENND